MAVFEEKCCGVQCDHCKETYINEHSGFGFWTDKNTDKEEADDDGWIDDGDKIYCPNCAEINDDDEVVLKVKK